MLIGETAASSNNELYPPLVISNENYLSNEQSHTHYTKFCNPLCFCNENPIDGHNFAFIILKPIINLNLLNSSVKHLNNSLTHSFYLIIFAYFLVFVRELN